MSCHCFAHCLGISSSFLICLHYKMHRRIILHNKNITTTFVIGYFKEICVCSMILSLPLIPASNTIQYIPFSSIYPDVQIHPPPLHFSLLPLPGLPPPWSSADSMDYRSYSERKVRVKIFNRFSACVGIHLARKKPRQKLRHPFKRGLATHGDELHDASGENNSCGLDRQIDSDWGIGKKV